ncbi:MAG TPA: DUF6152 family protein [Gammaproteobacteria bacterium]|nr:DUF6152 family protein [Gammaproteobacteria bacterium]
MTKQWGNWVVAQRSVLCAFGVLVTAAPAVAHHSRAAFDTTVEITIEGVVADVTWANPHVYFTLEVAGADGSTTMQQVEVGPLSTLGPIGLNREVLVPGERVTVRANPHRRGSGHTVVGLDVTTSDGSIYPLHVSGRSQPPPVAQKADSLAGKWVPTTAGWLAVVQGSRNWPTTEVGRQGVADTVSQQASQAECAAWPAPVFMAFPALLTVNLRTDVVTLGFDWMNGERTIHMNLTDHPADLTLSLQGHSIGHWDGTTLVIDTVGFAPHREGVGFGIPSGERKHLTERLTLSEDRTSITYEFTVEDSLSLTEPVTRSVQWSYRPDLEPSGQQCDPEIATRFLRE